MSSEVKSVDLDLDSSGVVDSDVEGGEDLRAEAKDLDSDAML